MSRLSSIIDDDGTTLASYQYIGADTIVREYYNQPNVSLDYTARDYSGFDPFGRIAEQLWENMTSLTDPSLASPSRGVAETCAWDAWGRLASVAEPNSRGGTTTFAYSYDGTGRLVGTTTTVAGPHGGGRVTASADNYYAGSQLIETDVSDGTVYQYVWSARAADPILRDTIAGPALG